MIFFGGFTALLSLLGRRSFAVAGPTTWNSLSADLRDPTCNNNNNNNKHDNVYGAVIMAEPLRELTQFI